MRKGKLMFMLMVVLVLVVLNLPGVLAVNTEDSCGIHFGSKTTCGGSDGLSFCTCEYTSTIPLYNYLFQNKWKCEPCTGGQVCDMSSGRAKCITKGCDPADKTLVNGWKCMGSNECQCKADKKLNCALCSTKNCDAKTGRCEGTPNTNPADCKATGCNAVGYKNNNCVFDCRCQGCSDDLGCVQAVQKTFPTLLGKAVDFYGMLSKDYASAQVKGLSEAQCKVTAEPYLPPSMGGCTDIEYSQGGMCKMECPCTGAKTPAECLAAVQKTFGTRYSGYTQISADKAGAFRTVSKKEDCLVSTTGAGGGGSGSAVSDAEKKKQAEDKQKAAPCSTEGYAAKGFMCQPIATCGFEATAKGMQDCLSSPDTCVRNKCPTSQGWGDYDVCCKAKTAADQTAEQKAAYDQKIQEIATSIAEKTCKPALEKSQDEWEAQVTKAKSQCDEAKLLLPQEFLPLASQIAADCKKAIENICKNVEVSDKKTTQLNDCTAFCKDPDGCTCYMDGKYQCEVGQGDSKQVIRYQPGPNIAHIQQGSNCLGASNGICSGTIRDGVCPRQCFFFNDVDCQSQKTTGYLLGDIAMRFLSKEKWYTDFMEWISGWSKWIDPKQWMKSWCNPANRNQGIMDSIAVYSDDGQLYAWYGGEMAIYNYTKQGQVSRYLYTITWGIGNLPQNASYKITLMKDFGGKSVRAFPANAAWYSIKVGQSQQGKNTAKAFFLKDVYNYVCMEFSNSFEGSTQHCRQISAEGEYRATGDPAVVTAEGYTTAAGSTNTPDSDSGVNCELSGSC